MKKTINNLIYAVVITITISSLFSCSSDLTRNEAKKLISEKDKLPHDDIVNINSRIISIWTPGGYWNNTIDRPPTISFLEDITKSEIYSSTSGFSTNNQEGVYFAKGDFNLYKKYKEMGLIEPKSFIKGEKALLDGNGNPARDGSINIYGGCYWDCVFSLTQKANDLGINNWQYKAADWVFGEITGIFNNKANKTADVEYTIKTENPTKAANLFGWNEKKQTKKVVFKLYDDGWRIE